MANTLNGQVVEGKIAGSSKVNDLIIVDSGTELSAYGYGGKDTFEIKGGSKGKFYAGADDDEIIFSNGLSYYIYGDTAKTPKDNDGVDTFKISGGKYSYFFGAGGQDIFEVSEGYGNKVYGGADSDIFTLSGGRKNYLFGDDGKEALVTDVADTYHIIGGSSNYIYAGGGEDILNVEGGQANRIYGGNDGDILNLKDGYKNYIYMDNGKNATATDADDTLNIMGGQSNFVYAAGGKDTFNVSAGTSNKLYGWEGNDIVNLTGGTKNSIFTDMGKNGTSRDGNDEVNVMGGESNYIYTAGGADIINVTGGYINRIFAGVGDDFILIDGSVKNYVYADRAAVSYKNDGNDTITMVYGEDNYVYGDAGDDVIEIQDGISNKFYGGTGNDTITVNAGSRNNIYTDEGAEETKSDGADKVIINGGDKNYYYTNGGKDTIQINGGSSNKIYAGSGDDSITLYGGKSNTVQGGVGNDTIFVEWKQVESGNIIDQTTAAETDGDALYIAAYSTDFKFTYTENNLTLKDNNTGKVLYIKGWENGLNTINFLDGKLVGNQIIPNPNVLIINDGLEHPGVIFQQGEIGEFSGYTVNVVDGSAAKLYVVKDIKTIYTDERDIIAANNTLNIEKNGLIYDYSAAWEPSGSYVVRVVRGEAYNNCLNINGGTVTSDLYGAYVSTGSAHNNLVTSNGGNITNNLKGVVTGTTADAYDNVVIINGGICRSVYGADINGTGNAYNNRVNIDGAKVHYSSSIYGAEVNSGEAISNYVSIKNISILDNQESNIKVYGGLSSTRIAQYNSIDAQGEFALLCGGYCHGNNRAYVSSLKGNEVTFSSGTAKEVFGGIVADYYGVCEDNQVVVSGDAIVTNNVYGAKSVNTSRTALYGMSFINNNVEIRDNAIINGNVYSCYREYTSVALDYEADVNENHGTITISDNAKVEGTIYGGYGIDTIDIKGGSVANIDAQTGNDIINIDWSKVMGSITIDQTTAGETDEDKLNLSGIEATEFSATLNGNTMILEDDTGKQLIIKGWGQGFEGITFQEGYVTEQMLLNPEKPQGQELTIYNSNTTVNTKGGDDTITIYGDNNTINTDKGNDVIVVEAGADGNIITAGAGDDTLTINGSSNQVYCNAGDDVLLVGVKPSEEIIISADNNTIDLGDGNNIIYVFNGQQNSITGGVDMDTIALYEGSSNITVKAGAGADELVVYGGNGHILEGGVGNDTYVFVEACFANLNGKGTYTLDQTTAGAEDYDCLDLSDYNSSDFTKKVSSTGTMTLNSSYYDVTINIKGWKTHAINQLQFKDQTLYYTNSGSQTTAPQALTASLLSFAAAEASGSENFAANVFDQEQVQDQLKLAGNM